MVSERIQRRIDALLDEADLAVTSGDWTGVAEKARAVLSIDEGNEDALAFLKMAEAALGSSPGPAAPGSASGSAASLEAPSAPPLPASFAAGRYRVLRLLGEGARKRVYLAHDQRLERDVAFAVIRTDGLDAQGRERVRREAQAMARLGGHPNLVTIHDIGEEAADAYLVQEYMGGGDLAGLLKEMAGGRLSIEQVLQVAKDVCRALAFIHRGGIIHRDLKPANVFLAADGTAKVGDFGLAMAADLTRITQHGTFIGTVAYMPPEQAVGGEVTAKSDLYSLGVLLYEALTGRPPFGGDDPTAIISQHLNMPPVAPSWHREDCPPSLEKLVLSLLEKDAGKRPGPASALLRALEAIDPAEQPAQRSEGHALERLARGVFVGREKELERLRTAFDDTMSGRGGLVMLVGEPGIGKTRTAQELETYARMRGAQVLWGRSHEQSGAPAFWPWVQVGRSWGVGNDLTTLTPLLASTGGDLARLFPELRNVAGFVEPQALPDAAAAQFRLFDSYTSFVRTISAQKPTVITLDDLHWADKPTLQLLQHVGRELSRMRVLVVCTYRDTDLVRTHPLSEALANLNRDPGFERIVLRGLTKPEVRSYIASTANIHVKAEVLDTIYEETEGNPFFLSEVVNLLTEEGSLGKDSVSDIAVPDGVKEALGRRLDRLSDEANALLQVAAVVGREFTYDTLQLLHTGDDDSLLKLIEEGLDARVIEEMDQPGRYRFTHALMQETLLGELSTTRRVRLHGRVGEALEKRWGDRAEEYASRLALHFSESASLTQAHAGKALTHLRIAARQCEERFAWVNGANLYEQVITLAGESGLPLGPVDEGDLLIGACRCHAGALEFRPAWRSLRRALALFEEAGEGGRYARAVAMAFFFPSPTLPPAERRLTLLDSALEKVPASDLGTRAALLLAKADAFMYLGDHQSMRRLVDEARNLTRGGPGPVLEAEARRITGVDLSRSGEHEMAIASYESAAANLVAEGYPGRAAEAFYFLANERFLGLGDLQPGAEALQQEAEMGRRSGLSTWVDDARSKLLGIAVFRGDHDAVAALLERPPATYVYVWGIFLAYYRLLCGDLAAMEGDLPQPESAGGIPWMTANILSARAQCFALAGNLDRARVEAAALRNILSSVEGFSREFMEFEDDYIRATLLGAPEGLASSSIAFARDPGRFTNSMFYWITHYPRARAEILVAAGRMAEAATLLKGAIEWCEREGCRAEAGRCRLAFADLEAASGNAEAALRHVDQAILDFQDYGASLFLEKAVARRIQLLGIADADPKVSILAVSNAIRAEQPDLSRDAATDGTVTIMFSDIEGSTAHNERLGDTRWMELLRAHNAILDREIQSHGGRTVKTIGDGYMVAFPSPEPGVRCALAVQAALEGAGRREKGAVLGEVRVRIGLHTGAMVQQGDDFFGREVNYAARVANAAIGGEILVSAVVRERLRDAVPLDDGREVEMKGFEGAHRVFGVRV